MNQASFVDLKIPQNFSSALSNIFLLEATYSADTKNYGFNPFLRPFVENMLESESGHGMKLKTCFTVHRSLTMVIANTLAALSLLDF